ncbi:hypothetical protein MRX96_029675 [Rhipicephalus microplus]
MVLAGYSPEIIMEACTRALAFWSFQMAHQSSCLENLCRTQPPEGSTAGAGCREDHQGVQRNTLQVAERENAKLRQCNEELRDQLERRCGAASGAPARGRPSSAATSPASQPPDSSNPVFVTDDQGTFFFRSVQSTHPGRQTKPPLFNPQ